MTPKEDLLDAMALVIYQREHKARNQALEEAAKVAEEPCRWKINPNTPLEIAAAIRALQKDERE